MTQAWALKNSVTGEYRGIAIRNWNKNSFQVHAAYETLFEHTIRELDYTLYDMQDILRYGTLVSITDDTIEPICLYDELMKLTEDQTAIYKCRTLTHLRKFNMKTNGELLLYLKEKSRPKIQKNIIDAIFYHRKKSQTIID